MKYVLDSRVVPIICANLGGWGERNVSAQLSGLLDGMKVLVGNDANVAALGEIWMGTAKGCRSAVMVTLGTGVGGGVIVNASSYASIMPTGGRGAYGVTKAAVSQMTRVMAAELAPDHIRVVAYMPGFVLTGINAAVIGEYDDGAVKRQAVQNRYGRTEEIARLVVFLASDAASFITGCGVEASGGKYCVQNPFAAWEKGN